MTQICKILNKVYASLSTTDKIGYCYLNEYGIISNSVTTFGDFCTLGNFSEPVPTIILPQIAYIFGDNFVKVSKSFIFLMILFLGNFYWHLATIYWSH